MLKYIQGGDIMNVSTNSICQRIRTLRKDLKLSQKEFGEKIGVSRDVIGNIEYQRVDPTELIIKQICSSFNVNYFWLTEGEGEMYDGFPDVLLNDLKQEFDLEDLDMRIIKGYLSLDKKDREIVNNFLKSFQIGSN